MGGRVPGAASLGRASRVARARDSRAFIISRVRASIYIYAGWLARRSPKCFDGYSRVCVPARLICRFRSLLWTRWCDFDTVVVAVSGVFI